MLTFQISVGTDYWCETKYHEKNNKGAFVGIFSNVQETSLRESLHRNILSCTRKHSKFNLMFKNDIVFHLFYMLY